MPRRSLTVTGTSPADRTAASTMDANSEVRHGRAAPPPCRVTLGAGQPKLRSTWSTRSWPTSRATARPTSSGALPYSWIDRGSSSGANAAFRAAFGSPSTSARAPTISDTYSPPP